ncbi:hypothetical protein [Streptosporangium sp. NPDC048865]
MSVHGTAQIVMNAGLARPAVPIRDRVGTPSRGGAKPEGTP